MLQPPKNAPISSLVRKTAGALARAYTPSIAEITPGAVPSLVIWDMAR
jgi:hypothetical protein